MGTTAKLTTSRDLELLETLTHRVRTLSIAQAARTWWDGTGHANANAARRIQALERAGWLERVNLLSRPEILLAGPQARWQPGSPPPDFQKLAYRLRQRWVEPPRAIPAVIATKQAGRWQGGHGGRLPRLSEHTHDLHLAAVYLWYREHRPREAARWQSEETIRHGRGAANETLPDALVKSGRSARAVEFAGQYRADKLVAFHAYCEAKGYGYELW